MLVDRIILFIVFPSDLVSVQVYSIVICPLLDLSSNKLHCQHKYCQYDSGLLRVLFHFVALGCWVV